MLKSNLLAVYLVKIFYSNYNKNYGIDINYGIFATFLGTAKVGKSNGAEAMATVPSEKKEVKRSKLRDPDGERLRGPKDDLPVVRLRPKDDATMDLPKEKSRVKAGAEPYENSRSRSKEAELVKDRMRLKDDERQRGSRDLDEPDNHISKKTVIKASHLSISQSGLAARIDSALFR